MCIYGFKQVYNIRNEDFIRVRGQKSTTILLSVLLIAWLPIPLILIILAQYDSSYVYTRIYILYTFTYTRITPHIYVFFQNG